MYPTIPDTLLIVHFVGTPLEVGGDRNEKVLLTIGAPLNTR